MQRSKQDEYYHHSLVKGSPDLVCYQYLRTIFVNHDFRSAYGLPNLPFGVGEIVLIGSWDSNQTPIIILTIMRFFFGDEEYFRFDSLVVVFLS